MKQIGVLLQQTSLRGKDALEAIISEFELNLSGQNQRTRVLWFSNFGIRPLKKREVLENKRRRQQRRPTTEEQHNRDLATCFRLSNLNM